jgi:hypothetical protein
MATASMVKYVNPLALATKQHKADNKFEEALGFLSKPLEAAANAIAPAKLSVEAKLKAAGAAGKVVTGKVSSARDNSSREDYSSYSSSSSGAAVAGETRSNALIDKILEGALNDKDISSSAQDAITLSNINSSTQDAITLSNINSSTQDAVTLSNINSSTQNEADTAFPQSA